MLLAPLMAWLAWRYAPRVAIDRTALAQVDWDGMLLFGGELTMLYVGSIRATGWTGRAPAPSSPFQPESRR